MQEVEDDHGIAVVVFNGGFDVAQFAVDAVELLF